jgi:O-antigen/teichoic acid export membrane protein
MKRVSQGQVLEALVRPIILAIVAAALIYGFGVGRTAVTAMTAQLVASAIVFVIGGVWVLRALPDAARHGSPYCARRSWLREAMPFLAISGASAVSRQVGILTLGVFATASDTGIYAAILRITEFAQMGTFSVAAIASPLIVEVLKKRDRQGLAQILKWGGRGAFGFGFLAVAGIVLLGGLILSAFGKEFPAGNGALHVMMLGALFGVFAGLSGILLAMSGHAGTRAGIGWASASCNLLGCLATVPHFGLHGAAFSYVFAMLVDGVLCLYFCWRYHKIWAGLR